MTEGVTLFAWTELHRFMTTVFVRIGMPEADARTETDALIWANLRGVDSHGAVRLPWYLENVSKGIMNPRPQVEIRLETPAVAVIEADLAFGPVVTNRAADLAVQKAKQCGIGWVLIRNHTHQGAMGQYAQRIAYADMAGLIIACAQPNMAPHGASVAGLNNCPLSISVPAGRHAPLLLDMATSVVALGKVLVARDAGRAMPDDWGLDAAGRPTTDPEALAALLPMSGPKGSGMALLFECLVSVMAGNALIQPVLASVYSEKSGQARMGSGVDLVRSARHNQNSVVAAIDIGRFMDVVGYKQQIDLLIDSLKRLPRAEGFEQILMPGEREEQCYAERMSTGIPLAAGTVDALRRIAADLGVDFAAPPKTV